MYFQTITEEKPTDILYLNAPKLTLRLKIVEQQLKLKFIQEKPI
jgi:hypothetical protein